MEGVLTRMKSLLTGMKGVLTWMTNLLTSPEGLLTSPAWLLQKNRRKITFAENGYFFCLVMANLGRNFGAMYRIIVNKE